MPGNAACVFLLTFVKHCFTLFYMSSRNPTPPTPPPASAPSSIGTLPLDFAHFASEVVRKAHPGAIDGDGDGSDTFVATCITALFADVPEQVSLDLALREAAALLELDGSAGRREVARSLRSFVGRSLVASRSVMQAHRAAPSGWTHVAGGVTP